MAKYVCDFDMVNTIGNTIKLISGDMNITANNYQTTITNDLSSWTGEAHSNFITSIQGQVVKINNNINATTEMAEFIIDAAQKIEDAENELASLSI